MTSIKELLEKIRQDGIESLGIYPNSYRGIVVSNEDPENMGRLKIKCPTVLGTSTSGWANAKGVIAGNNSGIWVIPQAGENVWVTFESGKPSNPIWEYGWWLSGKTPTTNTVDYLIKTQDGQSLLLSKTDDTLKLQGNLAFVSIVGTGVTVGQNTGDLQPMLLGNKVVDLLTSLINNLVTANAGGYPLSTAASIQALLQDLEGIKSFYCKIKE